MRKGQRLDNWTEREDKYLAETVLHHISQRSTQLKAFKEVGDKLDRSAAACGFRWNAVIKSDYVEEIKQAKRTRWGINPNVEKLDKGKHISKKKKVVAPTTDQLKNI